MEWLFITIGIILLITGLIGCIVPVLPGPTISYGALLILQLMDPSPFTADFMVKWALIVIAVTVLDYVVPIYGTKYFGGTKKGVWGSAIGLVLGVFFFPPFGIIIGPFIGAVVGEMIEGKELNAAFRSGFGSFIGFLTGTIMKLAVSVIITYHFIATLA